MPNARRAHRLPKMMWSIPVACLVVILALGAFNAITLPGCASCHTREGFPAATASAPHAKVDCRSCHVPAGVIGRLGFASRQPLHMFLPVLGGNERDAAAVPDSRCVACHEDTRAALEAPNGLRIAHESCASGASCTDCHSATAHGKATRWVRVYDMDRCLACHVSAAQTDCDLCHEGRGPENRIRSRTFAVTHGPQWRSTHGMGDVATCTVCHRTDDCVKCHGPGVPHDPDFVQVHAGYAVGRDAKCATCHDPSFCDGCHGTPMPHPAQFTASHPKTAAARRDSCNRCHVESDCTTCHLKHVHPGGAVGGGPVAFGGER